MFTVKHYAGAVMYHAEQFCEKNRDLLSTDLIEMMQGSSMSVDDQWRLKEKGRRENRFVQTLRRTSLPGTNFQH